MYDYRKSGQRDDSSSVSSLNVSKVGVKTGRDESPTPFEGDAKLKAKMAIEKIRRASIKMDYVRRNENLKQLRMSTTNISHENISSSQERKMESTQVLTPEIYKDFK
jgi:hypothetical protein